jgi:hypothetical protein
LHRLTSNFILGYHGCDRDIGERLLAGEAFQASNNDYDWLGPGVYFWEANPRRGLEFAAEAAARRGSSVRHPAVVGAVIELGNCLDLTTSSGIRFAQEAHEELIAAARTASWTMPSNSNDGRRRLDCAVITAVHTRVRQEGSSPIDTVKAVFIEGPPIYPTAGFHEKTHTQIAVCNLECIRGIFRVPTNQFR